MNWRGITASGVLLVALSSCSDAQLVLPVPSTTVGIWTALGASDRQLRTVLLSKDADSPAPACALLRGADRAIADADPRKVPSLIGGIGEATGRAAGACDEHPRAAYCLVNRILGHSPYRMGIPPSLEGWHDCNPRL